MKQLVKFPLEDGSFIMVETEEPEPAGGIVKAGRSGEILGEASQTFESTLQTLQPVSSALIEKLRGAANPPNEIKVEFEIKLSAAAGLVISKIGGEANFKVTLDWKRD
jgi:hypothetical protein